MKSLFNKKNIPLYILSFIIPVFAVLIGMLAGSYAPFGSKNVLTASGYNDYIPYYYELYDRIHSGTGLGYSNFSGLGYDFSSLVSYYISDPINLLILLFSRNSILSVLNILYVIKTGFSSFFMCLFFVYKKEHLSINNEESEAEATNKKSEKKDFIIGFRTSPDISIIKFVMTFDWIILGISVAYALSIFMIGTGMNIAYTGAIALLPLILFGVEQIINEEKSFVFVIFLSLSIFSNIHISIISLIFVILYTSTRKYDNASCFFKSLFKLLLSIIICAIITSIITINSIQGGFFTQNNSLFFPSVIIDNPLNSVRQMMSQGLVAQISMYGVADYSISVLGVLLFFIYIFQPKISIASKIKNIALLFLLLSGTCVSTIRYLFNGFNLNSRQNVDFGYIICFFILYLIFEEINNIHNTKPVFIIISFTLSVIIIFASMFFADSYDNSSLYIKTLEFLFGYFLIILIYSSRSMTKTLFQTLVSGLLLIEILVPNVLNVTDIGKFYLSQKRENISELLLYEEANALHSQNPDSKILIYNSNSSYDTPLTASLSGYDYIISNSKDTPYGYIKASKEYKPENSAITIYINEVDESLKCVAFPESTKTFEYNLQNPYNSSNQLASNYLNNKEVFKLIDINVEPSMASDGSSVAFGVSFDKADGYVYFNAYSASYLCNGSERNQANAIQDIPKSNDQNIKYAYTAAALIKDNYTSLLDNLQSKITLNKYDISNGSNAAYIELDSASNGLISTGVSNLGSLKYFVNGKKVNAISKINNNAMVPVSEGHNIITIKYSYTGIIIGIIGLIIGIIIFIFFYKTEKKNVTADKTDDDKNDETTDKANDKAENIETKTLKTIASFFTDNYVYIMSVLIVFFTIILCQMITSSKPFGVFSIVRDDGIAQYYSTFVSFIDSIKSGDFLSTTSYNSGGFSDVARYTIPNLLAFPYGFLTFLLSPKNSYLMLFTIYYIQILLFSPVTIIFYLTHKHNKPYQKSDKRLIIYASLYSLSSYSAVFFQYYVGFRLVALFPIIILGMEQLIYKKKPALYICSLTYMMIIDAYAAFLLCEFMVLFFFIQYFSSPKDFLAKGCRFAISSIISALLSAVNLIPFYLLTRLSPYMETDQKDPSILKTYVSYIQQIAEYHPGNAIKAITENNAQTASYCGLIMIFIIPLYLMNKSFSTKEKIKKILLITLLFIGTNNELLNYIFHGFHFQTLAPNRFTIFIIFLLVTILADIRLGEYEYSKRNIATVVLSICVIISGIYFYQYGMPTITIVISYFLVGLYFITALVIAINRNENKLKTQKILLYISLIDILINAVIVFPINIGSKSDIIARAARFDSISESIPDINRFDIITEFVTDDSAYKNIGKISNLHTLSFFDSAITRDTMSYISFYNLETGGNHIIYKGNPLADIMLRVKYNIVDTYEDTSYSIYPKVYQENEFELHQNPYYISLGFMTNNSDSIKSIDSESFDNSFTYQNTLIKELGCDAIYDLLECEQKKDSKESSEKDNADLIMYECGEPYEQVESNTTTSTYIPTTLYFPDDMTGKVYVEFDNIINFAGELGEQIHEISYDCPVDDDKIETYKPHIAVLNEKALKNLYNTLYKEPLSDIRRKGNTINSNISNANPGMLYISLPYYDGWSIYVDGTKTEKEHYLGGIGINIAPGNHSIKMIYQSPGLIVGLLISITTLLSIIIYYHIKESQFSNKT